MKHFYTCIFFLSLFIVGVSYYNSLPREPFVVAEDKNIVLLGDSILKNNNYVKNGKGVDDLLIERNRGVTTSLAIDNSTIVDVYKQISSIPIELNTSNTTVFLSIGGNNLLQNYVGHSDNNLNDKQYLTTIFAAYRKLARTIREKMTLANIVLLDIYFPQSIKYKQYHDLITDWNEMVYNYAKEQQNGIAGVIKISGVLTDKGDFTLGIEPSDQGGAKIVELIANYR